MFTLTGQLTFFSFLNMIQIDYSSMNLIFISLIIILFEAILGGNERYRIMKREFRLNRTNRTESELKLEQLTKANSNPIFQTNAAINSAISTSSTRSATDQTKSSQATVHNTTVQSSLSTIHLSSVRNASQASVSMENTSENLCGKDQLEIVYILAYICLIFVMLFITYHFRSIVRLYTFIYALLIVFVTFVFQQKLLIYIIDLSRLNVRSNTEFRNAFRFRVRSMFGDRFSMNRFKQRFTQPNLIRSLIWCLIFSSYLVISIILSYTWYLNRLDDCFWLYHDLLGILICVFIVSALRLSNFQQIIIAVFALAVLDLFFVHLWKTDGDGLMKSIARVHTFKRRSLDAFSRLELNSSVELVAKLDGTLANLEELNVHRNTIDQVSLDKNPKHFRLPCIFYIPSINLVDAIIHRCVKLKRTAIIGFGDLIVAGMFSSYCYYFDRVKNTTFIYLSTSIFASLISLILMITLNDVFKSNGQAVLLYIVPINSMLLICLAYRRQEFQEFWRNLRPNSDQFHEQVCSRTVHEELSGEEVV